MIKPKIAQVAVKIDEKILSTAFIEKNINYSLPFSDWGISMYESDTFTVGTFSTGAKPVPSDTTQDVLETSSFRPIAWSARFIS